MQTNQYEMDIIFNIGRQLTTGASLDELLHRIVAAAAELTNSESAGILLYNESDEKLHFIAVTLFEDRLLDIPVPIQGSIAGASFTSGKPVIVTDPREDPRYYVRVEETINFTARSLLAAPLQFKEHKIGVIEAENKRGDSSYSQADVEILMLLASQATVAIENVRLYQAAQQELAERIRIEEELRHHRDHLADLVEERTANLKEALTEAERLNMQLQQEIAERERLIGDLRAFSHMVAHDIKGPLGTILGFGDLMAREVEGMGKDSLIEWCGYVTASSLKINKIVEELLLLARIRQQEIAFSTLDMTGIVSEVENRLKQAIERSHAQIIKPKSYPTAWGYAPWVEEVWANYASNAIKYGGKPPLVELGAQSVTNPETGACEVRFWVHDNANELSAEAQSRLFTEFERLGNMQTPGHGLGLSIVKRIVEKLGGRVGVESTPGQGNTFFFTLPGADPAC